MSGGKLDFNGKFFLFSLWNNSSPMEFPALPGSGGEPVRFSGIPNLSRQLGKDAGVFKRLSPFNAIYLA